MKDLSRRGNSAILKPGAEGDGKQRWSVVDWTIAAAKDDEAISAQDCRRYDYGILIVIYQVVMKIMTVTPSVRIAI